MLDFIQMATKNLGLSEAVTTSATGGLVGAIKNAVPAADFTKLAGKVPGLSDIMGKAASAGGGAGGGALGGILGAASSMLGGKLGAAAGLASTLTKTGLSADKMGPFAGMLVNYLKGKAGNDIMSTVMSKMPDLQKLIG